MKSKHLVTGAALSVLLLTACMSGGSQAMEEIDKTAFENPEAGTVPADSLAGTKMTFVSWGGDFQNGQQQAFGDPFGEESGAEILYDGPTDTAKLRAQVESGNVSWDVVNGNPTYGTAYCDELYEPLDLSLIDTSLIPDGMAQGECFLPSLAYVYGFFYNAEKYGDNPPTSWEDFFDTERFPGTRAVDGRAVPTAGTLEAALLADGVAEDELYPLDIDRALTKWSTIKDSLAYWTSGAQQTQMAQAGSADMVFGWSGRLFEANQNGTNFVPVWNQSFITSDSFSIVKGTKNPVAAHSFINYALGAQQQATMAELTSYSPANIDAEPQFSSEAQDFNVTSPEVLDVTIPQNPAYWGENLDPIVSAWEAWLNS